MGNEQSVSEEPSQVKRRRAETVRGAEPTSFSFLIPQTEKVPEKLGNGSVNGLSEISGESWSLIACFCGSSQNLSCPGCEGPGCRPVQPVQSCSANTDSQLGPGPPESTTGVFELFDLSWRGLCRSRTPTAARVCLRAHADPGDDEDVTFSHRLAHVYFSDVRL